MLAIHGRKFVSLVMAFGGALLLALGLLAFGPVTPTQADPDIDQVSDKVDRLYHEAEQASERYNAVQVRLKQLRGDLSSLRADQARQQRRLDAAQERVEDAVVRQYQGQSVSNVAQILTSDDPSTFLGQLSTMSEYNDLQTSLFGDYATELKALTIRTEATAQRESEIAAAEKQAAADKAAIDKKLAEARDVLADLKAEQRAELASRSSGTDIDLPDVPASGRAAVAVRFALSQVGKAYVYGAAGPNAYDCSGLTMRAWGAAGVGLPHSSSAQMGSGPRVSASSLRPGDLVFYYSPVSHVGIYIGGGRIVHAARPGVGVTIAGVFSMPFSGAVRPG